MYTYKGFVSFLSDTNNGKEYEVTLYSACEHPGKHVGQYNPSSLSISNPLNSSSFVSTVYHFAIKVKESKYI